MKAKNRQHTLIVGGTRGIGRVLVKILSEHKQAVSVIGRRPPLFEKDKKLADVNYETLDLREQSRFSKVFDEIIRKNGRLDNLIFFQRFRGDEDDWQGELDVTLTATKKIIDLVSGRFNTRGGSIVITSSVASYFIADEQPLSYHVGKAGLNQLVRYYAVKLGANGIRVNAICPGTVLKEESKEFYRRNRKLMNLYKKIIPLGRMGASEDVTNLAAFLCSPQASFLTGQTIILDGGLSIRNHESIARKLVSLDQIKITRSAVLK